MNRKLTTRLLAISSGLLFLLSACIPGTTGASGKCETPDERAVIPDAALRRAIAETVGRISHAGTWLTLRRSGHYRPVFPV